jgi:hypothetical protein
MKYSYYYTKNHFRKKNLENRKTGRVRNAIEKLQVKRKRKEIRSIEV